MLYNIGAAVSAGNIISLLRERFQSHAAKYDVETEVSAMSTHDHNTCSRLFAKGDSCGAIVLRADGDKAEVLMLSHGSRGWVFPKNRQQEGESETDAAKCEVLDTAGIEIEILPGFRFETGSGLKKEDRKIIYYLARPLTETLTVKDPDHSAPAWQDVSAVESLLRFPEDLPPFLAALEDWRRR